MKSHPSNDEFMSVWYGDSVECYNSRVIIVRLLTKSNRKKDMITLDM